MLSGVPGGEPAPLPARESEAFALIRAQLRLGSDGRPPGMILLAAAARGEGASTTARELAAAGARVGSRALLVQADLRDAGTEDAVGLSDVLAGAASLQEAIRRVALSDSGGPASAEHTLDVLGAGSASANVGELLESRAMTELLGAVRASYDLVVLDSAPLSEASDAYPLLGEVDGVIVVARLGRTRGESAERLFQILQRSGAPLLGVIANGAGRHRMSVRPRRSPQPAATGAASPAASTSASPATEELVST